MKIRRTASSSSMRIYVVMALMGTAFLVLAGSLWRLQVARVSQFESRQKVQSLRRVRLPGIRGKIYDRNGLCLADNRPVYSIALFPEDVRRPGPWSKTIDRAMEVMGEVAECTPIVLLRDTPNITFTNKNTKDELLSSFTDDTFRVLYDRFL